MPKQIFNIQWLWGKFAHLHINLNNYNQGFHWLSKTQASLKSFKMLTTHSFKFFIIIDPRNSVTVYIQSKTSTANFASVVCTW